MAETRNQKPNCYYVNLARIALHGAAGRVQDAQEYLKSGGLDGRATDLVRIIRAIRRELDDLINIEDQT